MPSDAIWIAVVTLVGAGLGYIAKPLGDVLLQRRNDAAARAEAGRLFQKETLLSLQAELVRLVDRAVDTHIEDRNEVERWEGYQKVDTTVAVLHVRVSDGDVRARVRDLRTAAKRYVDAQIADPDDYEEERGRLGSAFDQANERLGEVLRALYPNE